MFKKILKQFLTKYVYSDWNIAIADISENLEPVNVKWLKHNYNDRWFADPFIISEDSETLIILVEEYLFSKEKGRIARLTINKDTCEIINNETLLELSTHLSFPNYFKYGNITYLYPENAKAGITQYYRYGNTLIQCGILSHIPFADPVITDNNGRYYLLATTGEKCNGNILEVYESENIFGEYTKIQQITFKEDIARRAGNIFEFNGKQISPAQINNKDYGEGLSFQQLEFTDGKISLNEFKRLYPLKGNYPDGLHTFNVFGNKVAIDGYRYRSKLLRKLYVKIRRPV